MSNAVQIAAGCCRDNSGGTLTTRTLRYLRAQIEDWADACRSLSDWEDEYLLEGAAAERHEEHSRRLDELERVGHWFDRLTLAVDFPEVELNELVQLSLQDLRDRRALWHGRMSEARRQQILHEVFGES